jgi:hypothetical protein
MMKGGKNIPALKHLIEDLRKLSVGPDEVSITGQLYDDLIDDAEDIAEENQTEGGD